MYEMIEKRPDWCVSRQRFWGVPIIVFYCEGCGTRLEDFKALGNVVKWFEKEGADAWYQHTPEELLPAGTTCTCGATKWRKQNDILDVWFDSGSSNLAVLKGTEWPADVYLEGPEWYANYEFHRVYHAIHDYCVVDLSAFYFDVLKDRLYTKAPRNKSRRSAQTAIWKISSALVRLAAPILVFTSEEIWKYFPKSQSEPESVHLALFPEAAAVAGGLAKDAAEKWERLAQVRSAVLLALEQARAAKAIGGNLEAKVLLHADPHGSALQKLLEEKRSVLPALFIVSQVEVQPSAIPGSIQAESLPELSIKIDRADGAKCDRCWNYSTHVGENSRYPKVCERCSEALAEIERDGSVNVAAT